MNIGFHRIGPFTSQNGDVYFVTLDPSTATDLRVYKVADPVTGSFSEADSTNRPTCSAAVRTISARVQEDADEIYIVCFCWTSGVSHYVEFLRFDMGSDAWNATIQNVDGGSMTVSTATTMVGADMWIRLDGSVVALYVGDSEKYMGVERGRVWYNIRSAAGSWGTPVGITSTGVATDYAGSAVVGCGDRVHFFYSDYTNGTIYLRTLSAADALAPAAPGTNCDSTNFSNPNNPFAHGGCYFDGTNWLVSQPHMLGSGASDYLKEYSFTSSDNPGTPTKATVSTTRPPLATYHSVYAGAAHHNLTHHYVWESSGSNNINRDEDDNGAGWGTDAIVESGSFTNAACNVIDYGRGPKLAVLYGTGINGIRYNEVDVTTTWDFDVDARMPYIQNYPIGPFEI
jgi:hypothetical protein